MFTNTVFTKQRDVMYTRNSVIVSKIARGDATNGEIWREGVGVDLGVKPFIA